MNTITRTASKSTNLAIDLGKYKSVACVHDQASGEVGFTTFETTRAEVQKLIGKVQPAIVIIEACLLAGWVHICAANSACVAWSPTRLARPGRFKHLKRKTDKDDALRLAQLYLLDQLPSLAAGLSSPFGVRPLDFRGHRWVRRLKLPVRGGAAGAPAPPGVPGQRFRVAPGAVQLPVGQDLQRVVGTTADAAHGLIGQRLVAHLRHPQALRWNDQDKLPGRLQRLHVAKSRDAGPVNFIGWFGDTRPTRRQHRADRLQPRTRP